MTTKAWTFTTSGPPSTILALTPAHPSPPFPPPLPLPAAAPDPEEWLLLSPSHTALNAGSLFHMAVLPPFLRAPGPVVPEMDLAATVLDVWAPTASPSAPPRFRPGDKVVAFLPIAFTYPTGAGALAGQVACPARYAVRRPEGVSGEEAAGLLLAGCMAMQMLEDGGVGRGDRVLVYGASGGVGSMCVQLARERVGAEGWVVGVCSGGNGEMVRGLGADEVIDYLAYKSLPAELRRRFASHPLDCALDCWGNQAVYVGSAHFLKPAAAYVAVGIHVRAWTRWGFAAALRTMLANRLWPRTPWLGGTGRRWVGTEMMAPRPEMMECLVGMLAEGKVRVPVDSVWEFEEALGGYAVLESGRARGKVIVRVNEEEEDE